MAAEAVLEAAGLEVGFPDRTGGFRRVLRGVSFRIHAGERVGLVGPSGCGKSLTTLAILGLVPEPGRLLGGTVRVAGRDASEVPDLRGGQVGLVLQEAASALNPVYSVGFQLTETLRAHGVAGGGDGRRAALALLAEVALDPPQPIFAAYPHQLSGGQAQRVMLALALAGSPKVLLADEPTTALDVVTQARVLELLVEITDRRRLGLLLVSHDLGLVSALVHRVLVMDDGAVVEEGAVADVFAAPSHPATRQLVEAARRRRDAHPASHGAPT
jgi:ABC-type dipeptide/oligopeptide/nickel transport system ATPase component